MYIFYEIEKAQYLVYICIGMYGMFKLQYDFCFYFSSPQIILPTQSLHNGKHLFSYIWYSVLQFQFCKISYLSIKITSCTLDFGWKVGYKVYISGQICPTYAFNKTS